MNRRKAKQLVDCSANIWPGKIFLQIEFRLIAMKSGKIPTTVAVQHQHLDHPTIFSRLCAKGGKRFTVENLNARTMKFSDRNIFTPLVLAVLGKNWRTHKTKKCANCLAAAGRKCCGGIVCDFILVSHETRKDVDVKIGKAAGKVKVKNAFGCIVFIHSGSDTNFELNNSFWIARLFSNVSATAEVY